MKERGESKGSGVELETVCLIANKVSRCISVSAKQIGGGEFHWV